MVVGADGEQARAFRTRGLAFIALRVSTQPGTPTWMGVKMKAGMVIYGDNAAGALVDETDEDDDDLRREMIRHALQGQA